MVLLKETAPAAARLVIELDIATERPQAVSTVGLAAIVLTANSGVYRYDNFMYEIPDAEEDGMSSAGVEVYTRSQLHIEGTHPDEDIDSWISSTMPRNEPGTIMVINRDILYAAHQAIAKRLLTSRDMGRYPEEAIADMLVRRTLDGRKIDYVVSEAFDAGRRQTEVTYCKVDARGMIHSRRATTVSLPYSVATESLQ